jgi:hypothetical protein
MAGRNPDWSREETILALELYFRHRPKLLDDTDAEVVELSALLRRLAALNDVTVTDNLRNPNGVAMKLGNLSSHDPVAPTGRKGLRQGAKGLEAAVWTEFGDEPELLRSEAARIRTSILDRILPPEVGSLETLHVMPGGGRIFVTGMWGFNPENEGYVGFSHASVRDRYVSDYQPGDLMVIVGQRGEFSVPGDVGRVLGLVDLEPRPIEEQERFAEGFYERKVERFGPDRWRYALPIRRAWVMSSAIKAKHLAPETCAARNARVVGANYLELTPAEENNVLSARMKPVRAFGADEWNALIGPDEPEVLGRVAVSRGPRPSFGERVSNREDGETCIYVMELRGCVDAMFPTTRPAASKKVVLKIGMSNDPERRRDEMNGGFPPGAELSWEIIRTKAHPNGDAAYDAERRFLDYLDDRGLALGFEFACVPRTELETLLLMFVDRSVGVTIS